MHRRVSTQIIKNNCSLNFFFERLSKEKIEEKTNELCYIDYIKGINILVKHKGAQNHQVANWPY